MKQITETELKNILDQHKLWIESEQKQGKQANLAYAILVDAYLVDANLIDANLDRANLKGANLKGANLIDANLVDANLVGANLEGTCLEGMGEPTKLQQEQVVGEAQTLRAKFDEFAKSLGLEIVTLSVKRTVVETINL